MSDTDTTTLDQQIESTRIDIANLEATIASLSASGHEITNATAHLRRKIETLSNLVRVKLERE